MDSGFHQQFLRKSDAISAGRNGQASGTLKPGSSAQLQLNPKNASPVTWNFSIQVIEWCLSQ